MPTHPTAPRRQRRRPSQRLGEPLVRPRASPTLPSLSSSLPAACRDPIDQPALALAHRHPRRAPRRRHHTSSLLYAQKAQGEAGTSKPRVGTTRPSSRARLRAAPASCCAQTPRHRHPRGHRATTSSPIEHSELTLPSPSSRTQTVKEVLQEIVPERRALLAELKKDHGSKTLGQVTVDQVRLLARPRLVGARGCSSRASGRRRLQRVCSHSPLTPAGHRWRPWHQVRPAFAVVRPRVDRGD